MEANEGSNAAAGSRSTEGNSLGKGIRVRWMLVYNGCPFGQGGMLVEF